jgi:WD40 repeat protein
LVCKWKYKWYCKSIFTFTEHTGYINSIAISRDGQWIVTGSNDNSAKVWDGTTGECIHSFKHCNKVTAVTFSIDSEWVVSGSDSSVQVWNRNTGECIHSLDQYNDNIISSLCVSADKNYIVCGTDYNSKCVFLWNVNSYKDPEELYWHNGSIKSLAISTDGKWIVTGSFDTTIIVWSQDYKKQIVLEGHTYGVNAVAISIDGNFIVSSSERTLKVWRRETGECIKTFEGHGETDWIISVIISKDGNG